MAPPHPETWLRVLPEGLYCEPGGFFIDPPRPVERAVITHGHSDHARPGHAKVLATAETLAIMRARMGGEAAGLSQQALGYGQALDIGACASGSVRRGMSWARRRSAWSGAARAQW
jgi:putative mRNA 3-end processing factor